MRCLPQAPTDLSLASTILQLTVDPEPRHARLTIGILLPELDSHQRARLIPSLPQLFIISIVSRPRERLRPHERNQHGSHVLLMCPIRIPGWNTEALIFLSTQKMIVLEGTVFQVKGAIGTQSNLEVIGSVVLLPRDLMLCLKFVIIQLLVNHMTPAVSRARALELASPHARLCLTPWHSSLLPLKESTQIRLVVE